MDYDKRLIVVIDEIVFLESQLEYLQTLPFIRVHPKDTTRQKETEASRQYVKLTAQYNTAIRVILSAMNNKDDNEKISPLREWLNKNLNKRGELDES